MPRPPLRFCRLPCQQLLFWIINQAFSSSLPSWLKRCSTFGISNSLGQVPRMQWYIEMRLDLHQGPALITNCAASTWWHAHNMQPLSNAATNIQMLFVIDLPRAFHPCIPSSEHCLDNMIDMCLQYR